MSDLVAQKLASLFTSLKQEQTKINVCIKVRHVFVFLFYSNHPNLFKSQVCMFPLSFNRFWMLFHKLFRSERVFQRKEKMKNVFQSVVISKKTSSADGGARLQDVHLFFYVIWWQCVIVFTQFFVHVHLFLCHLMTVWDCIHPVFCSCPAFFIFVIQTGFLWGWWVLIGSSFVDNIRSMLKTIWPRNLIFNYIMHCKVKTRLF